MRVRLDMYFFTVTPVRYDTVLEPGEKGGVPTSLYSSAMTPDNKAITYRYTVLSRDVARTSDDDREFAYSLERYHRLFGRGSSGNLARRTLRKPVVYIRRERWDGAKFHVDDEVNWLRRLRARLSLLLFSPAAPEKEPLASNDLVSIALQASSTITGPTQTWTADSAVVRLQRDGELRVRGVLAEGAPPLEPLPDDAMQFSAIKRDTGTIVSADPAYFTEGEIIARPGEKRRFALAPLSVTLGKAEAGPPTLTSVLVRRLPQVWSPLKFTTLGREIEFQPLRTTERRDFAAWVVVPRLPGDTDDQGSVIGVAVARLLSIAHRARTPVVAERRVWDGVGEHVELYGNAWADAAMPLIPREQMTTFLEQTLPVYLALNESHRLFALAEYYVRSFIEDTADHKFTFASIFMEAFKFSWAFNDAAPDMIRDVKTNGMVRGFQRPPTAAAVAAAAAKGKTAKNVDWTFEDLLKRYAGSAAGPSGFTFIENRNALFHTGLPAAAQTQSVPGGGSYQYLKPELTRLQMQMEDILLGVVLGYQGDIHEYGSDDVVTFPGRTPKP